MISSKALVILSGITAAIATTWSALADPLAIEREITLKSAVQVTSQKVCLGDLVEEGWVAGRCAIDKTSCCRWTIEGARSATFKRSEIQAQLSKLNWGGITLILKGAPETQVEQTHRALSEAELKEKIKAVVAAKSGEKPENVTVTNIKLSAPVLVNLSEESAWDVLLPEPVIEKCAAKIISTTNSTTVLGWAQVELRVEGDVYAAKRTLHPMDLVVPADFELKKANILNTATAANAAYRATQFPEGMRARQTIPSGTALTSGAIERMPMVKLGDTVTLILRGDNLKISTKGVVQGSAAIGDMVTVQLQRYNRTFRGRLLEGRFVEVWL